MEQISENDVLVWDEIGPVQMAELAEALQQADHHRGILDGLSVLVRRTIYEMGVQYLREDRFTAFRKLFKNAVPYIATGKVHRNSGGFFIDGNTNSHQVVVAEESAMACDCPLFTGTGPFEGRPDECSHIQAAKIVLLAEAEGETLVFPGG